MDEEGKRTQEEAGGRAGRREGGGPVWDLGLGMKGLGLEVWDNSNQVSCLAYLSPQKVEY